jgi:hypothetical protein
MTSDNFRHPLHGGPAPSKPDVGPADPAASSPAASSPATSSPAASDPGDAETRGAANGGSPTTGSPTSAAELVSGPEVVSSEDGLRAVTPSHDPLDTTSGPFTSSAAPDPGLASVRALARVSEPIDEDDLQAGSDQHHQPAETHHREPSASAGARLSLVTASTPADQQRVAAAIDKLSLEQALLDVEVANARVIDLTARLVEANQRAAQLRSEADSLRAHIMSIEGADEVRRQAVEAGLAERQAELDAKAAHLDAQKASTAYRWAAKVWNLRNALRS